VAENIFAIEFEFDVQGIKGSVGGCILLDFKKKCGCQVFLIVVNAVRYRRNGYFS
jgi:hypothetical protein